jgi:hypothetical protein
MHFAAVQSTSACYVNELANAKRQGKMTPVEAEVPTSSQLSINQ